MCVGWAQAVMTDGNHLSDQARLAAIVESSDDAIAAKDLHGTVLAWNRAAERLFGYTAAEMIGQPITMIFPSDRMPEEAVIQERIGRGERIDHYITERRRKDGQIIRVSVTISPLRDNAGRIVGASKIVRDLTEQEAREQHIRELQAELVHVQRLSEMGQFISALVHEVNQPLTAISNYLAACRRLAAADKQSGLDLALDRIEGQAQRTRDIVQRIRDFVRKRQVALRPENLSEVVDEAIALTRVSASDEGLKLSVSVGRDVLVHIDRIQVQQVLFNLLRNGIEAIQGQASREIVVAAGPDDFGMVEISVADNGPGLSSAVRDKLFQPFVTSKAEGMGMGLSVCRTIVEAHAGRIWADLDGPGGAVFRFTLRGAC